MGNRGADPLILNLALDGGEWSTSGPARFIPAKERQCPLDRQMGGSGHFEEKRSILQIPVVPRSKAWVSSRSLAWNLGSNPAGSMEICLLWVLCVVRYRGLCVRLISHPEDSYRVCVRVLLNVIGCNNNALHLRLVGRRRLESERKKENTSPLA
jgi:hypothetical protein